MHEKLQGFLGGGGFVLRRKTGEEQERKQKRRKEEEKKKDEMKQGQTPPTKGGGEHAGGQGNTGGRLNSEAETSHTYHGDIDCTLPTYTQELRNSCMGKTCYAAAE